jgi:GT2 family glycosyltransferase
VAILFGEYELLGKSGLFDADFYIRSNPEIAALNIDPLMHYLEQGCHERRDPSSMFDTQHYLGQCEVLGEKPANALIHYLTVGVQRGLTPRPNGNPGNNTRAKRPARKTRNGASAAAELSEPEGGEVLVESAPSLIPSPAYGLPLLPLAPAPDEKNAIVPVTVPGAPFPGYIDSFGYSSAAGGWIYNGWLPRPFRTDQTDPIAVVAHYERSQHAGTAILAYYEREDLDQKSIGVIAFQLTNTRVVGQLQSVDFDIDGVKYLALCGPTTERLVDQQLVDRVRSNLLGQAFANRNRTHLLSVTARVGFSGRDTLNSLSEPVFLEIDDAIPCPPDGVLLKGWHLAAPGVVRRIRVRSGPLAGEIVLPKTVKVMRPDVISAVGQKVGFSDPNVGLMAYVPGAITTTDPTYIEVELENDEVGFKSFTLSKRSGIDAIRRILEGMDIRYEETEPTFDNVLGPAIRSINAARLEKTVVPSKLDFGRVPDNAGCSVIIPLYGRIDFIEYQMAVFSRDLEMAAAEIIYVLDDPPKRRELEVLAQSVFERFRLPFRVLLSPQNLGFAPANNVGLRAARGQYICFLNSDAFPITNGWISRLIDRMVHNPDVGVLGAQLLFEDGSIQHEGCFFRQISEFGNWHFVEHFNKGRRPSGDLGLRYCDAVTGACMIMERSLVTELGGFDEAFIVGDFEDSDLCLRIKGLGLSCAVDQAVEMYHLERKSQAAPSQNWRMNLTLYNAWVHERRWSKVLQTLNGADSTSS